MKKVIVVRDTLKKSLKEKIACRIFDYKTTDFFGGEAAIQIIERESPDAVFCNFIKPVNESDLMNMLGQVDVDVRLRAAVYSNISLSNFFYKIFFVQPIGSLLSHAFPQKNEKEHALLRINKK